MRTLHHSCVVLLLLGAVLTGCGAARVNVPPPTGEEVTILVPGYRGSFLVTEGPEPERAWLTVGQALSRGERTLAIPFPGQRPVPNYGPLRPDGPMTKLSAVFASVDAYRSFMEFGRDHLPGFVPFSYDWRRDIRESAGALCARIEQLVAEGGGKRKVNIVAHSMGGLVTLHCLLHGGAQTGERPWVGAEHVKRVVIIGTPFTGGPGIFDDLLVGTETLRNRALLAPEALFTFASAFQLVSARSDFFVDAGGGPVEVDALDPAVWLKQGWGPFADSALREDEAYRAQLIRMLDAHRELHEALAPKPGLPAAPFETLVVVGTGRPTVSGVRMVDGKLDLKHPPRADGDGSVLSSRAVPVLPMTWWRVDSDAEHVALMSDREVLHAVERFLRGEKVGTARQPY
ncbi:lipase family alpha/beta hydrolase [Archangium lansingense]|uniref:Alpha/beta hydrolase n=1 Tax=Archangium lansingense TaxID=2995310 RepID=A0ABT3ZW35_9BACT|nr:alpha/beta hydrolase [Archangium lansinium]MCY1073623.1 alpha/beta hydrolase [Archangium lansinium]